MEAGNGAARYCDEEEREKATGEDRAGAVDELRHRRHTEIGEDDENSKRQSDNRSDLQERRQVVAGREKRPDRQNEATKP